MKPPRIVDLILKGNNVEATALREHLYQLNKVVGGKLSFGRMVPDLANPGKVKIANSTPDQNIENFKSTGTAPGVADTDFTITHTLGYIPTTIIGQDTTNGGVLYRSPVTAWTKTTITLRCTKASSQYNVMVA